MWNLKRNYSSELTYKIEKIQTSRTHLGLSGEGIVWEFGMDRYTLLY